MTGKEEGGGNEEGDREGRKKVTGMEEGDREGSG